MSLPVVLDEAEASVLFLNKEDGGAMGSLDSIFLDLCGSLQGNSSSSFCSIGARGVDLSGNV